MTKYSSWYSSKAFWIQNAILILLCKLTIVRNWGTPTSKHPASLIQFLVGRGTTKQLETKTQCPKPKQAQKVRLDLAQKDQIKIFETFCSAEWSAAVDSFGVKSCKPRQTAFKSPVTVRSIYYFFPSKGKMQRGKFFLRVIKIHT